MNHLRDHVSVLPNSFQGKLLKEWCAKKKPQANRFFGVALKFDRIGNVFERKESFL